MKGWRRGTLCLVETRSRTHPARCQTAYSRASTHGMQKPPTPPSGESHNSPDITNRIWGTKSPLVENH